MPLERHRRTTLCLYLLFALPVSAQLPSENSLEPQASTQSSPGNVQDATDVFGFSPALHGWNAGVTVTGVHESTTGWATIFIPAIGYSFNDVFSIEATIPIYMFRLADSIAAHPRPNEKLVTRRGEPGDLVLGLHAQFVPRLFQYQVTGLVTAPTGDKTYGLTTGRVTFDLSNRFERTYGRFTPNLEIGGGDSTTLVNRILTKNYTSLGPLAHFEVGLDVALTRGMSFETDAYEQLPIGDQKIYGPSRKGRPPIVTGHNVIEDNGFINAVDIPVDRHINFSGYYSRSLRLRYDTAAIGVTYVLRPTATTEEDTAIDDLFR